MKRSPRTIVALLALGASVLTVPAAAAPARAATPEWLRPESTATVSAPSSIGPWRIGLLLSATGGLLVAAWIARRTRRVRVADLPVADITVLATKRIGPKSQAVIVEVGGRVLLLGVSDSHVSRLYRLRDLETKQPTRAAAPAKAIAQARALTIGKPISRGRFAEMLDGMIDRRPSSTGLAPADLLAEATEDVVRRDPRRAPVAEAPEHNWDGEEQTLGLMNRLSRRGR